MATKQFPYKYRASAFNNLLNINHKDVYYKIDSLKQYGFEEHSHSSIYYVKNKLAGIFVHDEHSEFLMVTEDGHQFLQIHAPLEEYKKELPSPITENRLKYDIQGDLFFDGTPHFQEDEHNENIRSRFGKFSEEIRDEFSNKYFPVPLTHLSPNIFVATELLNIDVTYLEQFKYEDPNYGYEHYALVPVMAYIKPEHAEKYKEILRNDLSSFAFSVVFEEDKDDFFRKNLCNIDNYVNSSSIVPLLGAGYTDCTLPSDGSLSTEFVTLQFEDFYLVCLTHIWFNK